MKYHTTSNPNLAILVDDEGDTIAAVSTPNPNAEEVAQNLVEMQSLLSEAVKVIEDFMPNISRCVLQDYGRLNRVLLTSKSLLEI